jgi:acetyl esterase/lipase
MEELLTHPYASPLFGDFDGLPPMLITAGDAEVLRDEITLLAHKATLAGVDVRHELYEDAVSFDPALHLNLPDHHSVGTRFSSIPVPRIDAQVVLVVS